MKVSEIDRTSVVSWSPCDETTNYLCCGSMAGSLEADFSYKSKLDIFSISFDSDKGELKGSVETNEKFFKLSWGRSLGKHSMGLIAGAMSDGTVGIWDPNLIIKKDENSLTKLLTSHKTSVKGLDFNPQLPKYLATVSEDANLILWDMEKIDKPQVFSNKNSQQHKNVSCLKWNMMHNNILCTTAKNGTCVVWNADKKSPQIIFENSQMKNRYSSVAWNPEQMTQLVVASEDDNTPYIEFWELKKAYEPMRVLKGHTKGILSLSWCPYDSNLLISSGKDGRTIMWNPYKGEMLGELPSESSWMFDVQWSYRPSILSTANFDSKVTVYSIQDTLTREKKTGGEGHPFDSKYSQSKKGDKKKKEEMNFQTAPKWIQRNFSSHFGFGSKLVKVDNKTKKLKVYKICDDAGFVEKVKKLETVLSNLKFENFCQEKARDGPKDDDRYSNIWNLLSIMFVQTKNESEKKKLWLEYLGYDYEKIQREFSEELPKKTTGEETNAETDTTVFDNLRIDKMIEDCLVVKNFKLGVEICMKCKRYADALILAEFEGKDLLKETKERYFKETRSGMTFVRKIVGKEFDQILESWEDKEGANDWKKLLSIFLQFCEREPELKMLCTKLGKKLQSVGKIDEALVCYVFALNFNRTSEMWLQQATSGPENEDGLGNKFCTKEKLFEMVEKVMVFSRLVEHFEMEDAMTEKFLEFANILTDFGELKSSLIYLNMIKKEKNSELRKRVYYSLSKPFGDVPTTKKKRKTVQKPKFMGKKKSPKAKRQPIKTNKGRRLKKRGGFSPIKPQDIVPPKKKNVDFFQPPPPRGGRGMVQDDSSSLTPGPPMDDNQMFRPFGPGPQEGGQKGESRLFTPPVDTNMGMPPVDTNMGMMTTNESSPPVQEFTPSIDQFASPPTDKEGGFFSPSDTNVQPKQVEEVPVGRNLQESSKLIFNNEFVPVESKRKELDKNTLKYEKLEYSIDDTAKEENKNLILFLQQVFNSVFTTGNYNVKENQEKSIRKFQSNIPD